MDREHAGALGEGEDFALPSRMAAIGACRSALGGEPGPILLTGEAGSGKTWLWRSLAAGRRWLAVDLAPAGDPAELFGMLGHALGLAEPERARRPLADFLAEQAEDGRRWSLVVDEAHNASADVLEELRLLSNSLGRAGGFAAMILAGQTRLARRLGTAPLAALEARVSSRVHLRPIDADEARLLLDRLRPERPWTAAEADELHREAGGNPRRLLRLAASTRPRPSPSPRRPPAPEIAPQAAPRLGVDRPPLRVEEGMIEVGWDGPESDDAPTSVVEPSPRRALLAVPGPDPEADSDPDPEPEDAADSGEEEPIHDHYAALQAWDEWARNQGRQPARAEPSAHVALEHDEEADDEPHPQLQAHEAQEFAPYSQLFSRLKKAAADADGVS